MARLSGRSAAWLVSVASCVPGSAAAQQVGSADAEHDRRLEWAARLAAADRPDEALTVLEQLLATRPASEPALGLLLDIADRQGRVAPFLPRFERAAGPEGASSATKRLWVEALLAAGRADSARSVARGWAETRIGDPEAYRAWAAAEAVVAGPAAAAAVLRRGRTEIGAPAFATEIGLLAAKAGDLEAAVQEWVLLAEAGADRAELESSLTAAGADGEALGIVLRRAVRSAAPSVSTAATLLLLRTRRPDLAGRLAREVVKQLAARELQGFLATYAEAARRNGAPAEGAWAAGRLADLTADPERRDLWRSEAADLALAAGDSTAARLAFRQLVESMEPGSGAHRRASRRLFALSLANPDDAETQLLRHAAWYSDAPDEVAEMRVLLARGFVRKGRLSEAARVLSDRPLDRMASPSPHASEAQIAAELGRIRLFGEEVAEAVQWLERAAMRGATPQSRTAALRLSAALLEADSASAARLGQVLYAVARDATASQRRRTLREWELLEPPATMMLIVADELEDAGLSLEAVLLRDRLIEHHPEAPEAPVALLANARYEKRASQAAGTGSPSERLERLILDYPTSAVAPLARRLRAEWIAEPIRGSGGE